MPPLEPPSVLHIDPDPIWGLAVQRMIDRWPEVRHAGRAASAAEGLARCRAGLPDLVLLELRLPDADGFEVVDALAGGLSRPPRILLLTARSDDATLYRLTRLPVAGMVWKTAEIRDLLRAGIGEALAGRRFFPADVRAALRAVRCNPDAFFKILSERELAMLPLLCLGSPDTRIAQQTGLSPATVKSHRQHIMSKLNLHRAADLVRWAAEKGFIDLGPAPARGAVGAGLCQERSFAYLVQTAPCPSGQSGASSVP
jgi:DNA-binding NarL/FixJ family response regulator